MKKILLLTLTLLLSLACLFSCGESNVTIFSKADGIKASVIISDSEATNAETEAYNTVCSALQSLVGRDGFFNKTDVYKEAPGEIIVGNSPIRTATEKAIAFLNSSYTDDGDTAAYVIYEYNGSVAIVASDDLALSIAVDHFVKTYLVGETLAVKQNLVDSKAFSISAYKAQLDAELSAKSEAKFAKRWDEAMTKLGPEATAALQRLYDYYGTDWATWLFNLYDPETGCFYYSNSARDYNGFLVDVESTGQVFSILFNAGLLTELGNSWAKALPDEVKQTCLEYVQSMQDPDDGFFYHPQWGKDIGSSRRGRDLDSALGIISRMGGKPLYKTPYDYLGESANPTSSVISSFMSNDAHKSTVEAVVDERFQSEENMKAYLDQLVRQGTDAKGYFDSYTFGHTLSSETKQIIAAGLGDFVCSYIDNLQDPETGFYEKMDPDDNQAGYQAASGVIKISAFYSNVNGAIKYGDKMLDTLIEILLDPTMTRQMTYIFNPWGALSAAVSSIKQANKVAVAAGEPEIYNETKLRQKIVSKLPDLITATINKLAPYKQDDGSFSYKNDGTSLANNQGVITSLGYKEGDVNGLALAMDYTLGGVFGALGISRVPLLNYSHYLEFRDIVENAGYVVKQDAPAPELIDFEGGDIPTRVTHTNPSVNEMVEVVDVVQLNGEDGKALAVGSIANKYLSVSVEAKSTHQTLQCFTLSFDLYVDSADTGAIYQVFFTNTNQNNWNAYMLDISAGGGAVYIRDNVSNASNKKNSPHDLEITEKTDTWFNLKFEYYVLQDEESGKTIAKIKAYKNGVCVSISDNYFVNDIMSLPGYKEYLNDDTGTVAKPSALNYINQIQFFARTGPASKIMLDNIDCIPSASATFSDADVVPGAGLMVEPDTVTNTVIDFENGVADPDLFSGTNGFFTVETKATADNADNKSYMIDAVAGGQRTAKIGMNTTLIRKSVFTFEADICLDDVLATASGGAFQILFSDIDTHAFMLALDIDGSGNISLKTWNSTNGGEVVNLGVSAKTGEWFTLKIEYDPISDTEASITAYVNGERAGSSNHYYNKSEGKPVVQKINSITIYDRVAADCSFYIDNIKTSYDATKYPTVVAPDNTPAE